MTQLPQDLMEAIVDIYNKGCAEGERGCGVDYDCPEQLQKIECWYAQELQKAREEERGRIRSELMNGARIKIEQSPYGLEVWKLRGDEYSGAWHRLDKSEARLALELFELLDPTPVTSSTPKE